MTVAGCRPAHLEPTRTELVGRISLSLDASLDRSTLAVQAWQPTEVDLPEERLGLRMDACHVAMPVPRELGVLREAQASARCNGEDLELEPLATGAWNVTMQPGLPVGSRCEVTLDGTDIELPELLPPPDIRPSGRGLAWTPGDADELRVVVPLPTGELATCRLSDDGDGPRPKQLKRHTAFATRQSYAMPRVGDGRVAVSVASGVWLSRARAATTE